MIHDYVQTRYRLAAESTFGGEPPALLVFVDTRLDPAGEHPNLGLPCYRQMSADTGGFGRGSPDDD